MSGISTDHLHPPNSPLPAGQMIEAEIPAYIARPHENFFFLQSIANTIGQTT